MDLQVKAPYLAQDRKETADLISNLESNLKKTGVKSNFSCKKSTYAVKDGQSVDSWRFQDWDYKRHDLPIYARGLFTIQNPQGNPEIAIRGYDKFFNTGEVPKTTWANIEENTKGPYELSVKENGCIIFISGLPDNSLLVCSKHSTGARADAELSHAIAGERWIDKQLNNVGKTRDQLAKELRSMNATAVAELCDDNFEEHILAYEEDRAGLYLHGINLNLPAFATYPSSLVGIFAEKWGFKKTEFLIKPDIKSTRAFLEEAAETGTWRGKDVEGFVIRCKARDGEKGLWHDWFFKYKFEEPYLLYRQWREVTKAIISGKAPRFRKHEKITEEYLQYARRQLAADRSLGNAFNQNHGIIAMRNGFLESKNLTGSDIIRQEIEEGVPSSKDVTKEVVLVPIATIGCGKTAVAVALQKLFGWGHVQNDNITGKKGRPQQFSNMISSALLSHPVVIADRNNHQKRERKQLVEDLTRLGVPVHFVALHYVHSSSDRAANASLRERIRKVTRERVISRGDNHQTIRAGSKSDQDITKIMEGFMYRFEPFDPTVEPDSDFDAVIDLDVMASSRENVETVIGQLQAIYPKLFDEMPSSVDIDEAVSSAINSYEPEVKHDLDFGGKGPARTGGKNEAQATSKPPLPKIEFFCIRLHSPPILSALESAFQGHSPDARQTYRMLQQTRRLQGAFHVTLAHRANTAQFPEVWEHYCKLYADTLEAERRDTLLAPRSDPSLGTCRVQLDRVVWDSRVMAIVVNLLDAQEKNFVTTNAFAHITVGTVSVEVKPKESNDMLQKWTSMGSSPASGIRDLEIKGGIVLDGVVKGVQTWRR
ncbi:MAG: hypothetical protein M1829_003907 [Trizodia sp. TS-e1964]|nr:MAG: hypothetical protein M1829_003907 [Trizodia sp. TS-e1964]